LVCTLLHPEGAGSVKWRWRQHGPLKHWYLTTTLHSVTTQKTLTWDHQIKTPENIVANVC